MDLVLNLKHNRSIFDILMYNQLIFGFIMTDPILDFLIQNKDAITAATAIIALVSTAVYHIHQRHRDDQSKKGTFWLELEKMFQRYDGIYKHLRFQGGDWFCSDEHGPNTPAYTSTPMPTRVDEVASLCDYLGLFEHCYFLIKQKSIDLRTFESIYKTRIMGILSNGIIRNEELKDINKWSDFYELLKKIGLTDKSTNFIFGKDYEFNLIRVTTKFCNSIIHENKKYDVKNYNDELGRKIPCSRTLTKILCLDKNNRNVYCLDTGEDWKCLIKSNVWRRKNKNIFKIF
jgi:hypothetical protein